jgi:hypothetical protein
MKTGMSNDAEYGAKDCLESHSGREFIAHVLKDLFFMDVVPDVHALVAQGVGQDLFTSLSVISKHNALKLMEEHFMEGGDQHERSSTRHDRHVNERVNGEGRDEHDRRDLN